jgi:hypothetical protein
LVFILPAGRVAMDEFMSSFFSRIVVQPEEEEPGVIDLSMKFQIEEGLCLITKENPEAPMASRFFIRIYEDVKDKPNEKYYVDYPAFYFEEMDPKIDEVFRAQGRCLLTGEVFKGLGKLLIGTFESHGYWLDSKPDGITDLFDKDLEENSNTFITISNINTFINGMQKAIQHIEKYVKSKTD